MSMLVNIYIAQNLMVYEGVLNQLIFTEYVLLIRFSAINNLAGWMKEMAECVNPPKFSIYFDADATEENLEWLLRIIYLPNYHKPNQVVNLFINTNEYSLISKAITSQGFFKVEFNNINQFFDLQLGVFHGKIYALPNKETINVIIQEINFPIIDINENEGVNYLFRALFSPQNIRAKLKTVLEENEMLETINHKLSIELANHQEYLSIALKQKETEDILNFYHQQYEVLPLWYKRFGHIIKIIMGKRTLKRSS